jgi:predicted KAP-like P-loop ATPase
MTKPAPHIASISDRPIATDAEDALGRARFAKSIADLILSSPPKETLRIGIYGGWGEGKTSVGNGVP